MKKRVSELLLEYNEYLDRNYPDMPAKERLAKKWEMLRREFPHLNLPTAEEARAAREKMDRPVYAPYRRRRRQRPGPVQLTLW